MGEPFGGAKVIDRLSHDLNPEFPDMKGFSVRNLKYMRKFADVYRERTIVQERLAQITWYHHIALLDKVKDAMEREWMSLHLLPPGMAGVGGVIIIADLPASSYSHLATEYSFPLAPRSPSPVSLPAAQV
ncbi:DUF1016 N-terminal domain-containing protein [Methanoregula sp.]|uniref:DUF1016 N-terminal domain-containing protein n=1 Tax=Methanoregula sp. TaxID=2052170 RepID=UPI00356A99F8